jgi:hypothetical protein
LNKAISEAFECLKWILVLNYKSEIESSDKGDVISISNTTNTTNTSNATNTLGNKSKLHDLIKQKLITCLTAICLITEQINFNDFNPNLGISSQDEMKPVLNEEFEKNLIGLIQRSFEYQKLLNPQIIKKILSISKIIFGLNFKKEHHYFAKFQHFDNSIRLVYLQTVYLIALNKNGINLVSEYFEVIEILEEMLNYQDRIGDCKFNIVFIIFFS